MLKEKLKAALKTAGLSEELANNITITSEAQIEGIVIGLQSTHANDGNLDFNAVLGSPEFSEFITKTGFDSVLKLSKTLQSEHDKKVTAGIKTFQDKYFKKINGEPDPIDDPQPKDDTPAWAKKLMTEVAELKDSKTIATKQEQAKALLSKSKIPAELQDVFGNFDFNSETSLEDQLKGLETNYDKVQKSFGVTSKGLPMGTPPQNSDVTDADVEKLADNLI